MISIDRRRTEKGDRAFSPPVEWHTPSGLAAVRLRIDARPTATDADRVEVVAHLRALADFFESEAGLAIWEGRE